MQHTVHWVGGSPKDPVSAAVGLECKDQPSTKMGHGWEAKCWGGVCRVADPLATLVCGPPLGITRRVGQKSIVSQCICSTIAQIATMPYQLRSSDSDESPFVF